MGEISQSLSKSIFRDWSAEVSIPPKISLKEYNVEAWRNPADYKIWQETEKILFSYGQFQNLSFTSQKRHALGHSLCHGHSSAYPCSYLESCRQWFLFLRNIMDQFLDIYHRKEKMRLTLLTRTSPCPAPSTVPSLSSTTSQYKMACMLEFILI